MSSLIRAMLAALALAGALIPAACSPSRPVDARPALWRAQDGDTTIWLLGTIHLLPDNVRWRTPAIDRAIGQADLLVTEIPAGDPQAQAAAFMRHARAAGLPPLAARLPASERTALAAAVNAAGVSQATLDGLKTWAAAVTLSVGAARTADARAQYGVDTVLMRDFAAAGKPRRAFETLDSQLALFDALSEDEQRQLLANSIAAINAGNAGYRATLDAWATGDADRIAASFEPALADAPALEAALVTNRNAHWAGWIARRMQQPGTVLVAVGAGHLVGPHSVVAMLQARGIAVTRVE